MVDGGLAPEGFSIRAFGVAVRVLRGPECPAADFARVARTWADCAPDPDEQPRYAVSHRHYLGPLADGSDSAAVDLSSEITRTVIDHADPAWVLLHAAGLAHPVTGDAAAFVAPSGTGKSTLARTWGRSYRYLSDETVGIDPDGIVHGFPRPIVLRVGGEDTKRTLAPADHVRVGSGPAYLRAVVVLSRTAQGPAEPELTPVPTLAAIMELVPQTSYLTRIPRPLHRMADLLDSVGGARRLSYRDVDSLGPALAEVLGDPSAEPAGRVS